ncbi:50S ribosomal protein L14 [Candidatus Woesearchaeota archaeon]|jgi:large subunit ribosomal protein L14|nr:50S ribosomal protein L14 [Candidatus Woesearchaeota archaeon]
MKAVNAKVSRALTQGSVLTTCDNSGAKVIKIVSVKKRQTTTKKRMPTVGVGDIFFASVKKGKPEMRKQVVLAVLVRQRKEYRRPDGTRVKFEDNSAVILKDDKGNPKGTLLKGPIAKEVAGRWPGISKIASIIL